MNPMSQDLTPINDPPEIGALPFPFNQQNFCRYEPVHQSIDEARVLVADNLLRDERDLSSVAQNEFGLVTQGCIPDRAHLLQFAMAAHEIRHRRACLAGVMEAGLGTGLVPGIPFGQADPTAGEKGADPLQAGPAVKMLHVL